MKTANKTDVGRTRKINEDRVIVQTQLNGLTLAIIADGMGGHQAGDIASETAIETIHAEMQSVHIGLSVDECKEQIRKAILKANDRVFNLASSEQQYFGMGTTVITALASDEDIMIGHVGDSRAYQIHGNTIVQLTEDHSLVNELVKSGKISMEEAVQHPMRNVMTRALGTETNIDVDILHFSWIQHDMLLLCTDGLSGSVQDELLIETLQTDQTLDWKANRLVDCALEAGGDDNITVVIIANEHADDKEKG